RADWKNVCPASVPPSPSLPATKPAFPVSRRPFRRHSGQWPITPICTPTSIIARETTLPPQRRCGGTGLSARSGGSFAEKGREDEEEEGEGEGVVLTVCGENQGERVSGEGARVQVPQNAQRLTGSLTRGSIAGSILRKDALSSKPRKFLIDVEETQRQLVAQEDTDGDFQITVNDVGPKVIKVGTADSGGFLKYDIRGTYMLSNLLQELSLANDYGRKHIVLDEMRLNEN
ncbi:MAG: hypothetical protein BJ554DRAFT_1226, partial [Olpidium bornovanus]